RAGHFAAQFAKEKKAGQIQADQIEAAARRALEPFERRSSQDAEGAYRVQHDLQKMMQRLVGIVRTEKEKSGALSLLEQLQKRSALVRVEGNRAYNPGWHTALDLSNLLIVSEAVTRSAIERRESRGAQFREDCPSKVDAFSNANIVVRKGPDGRMQV